jgi:hypothetical protein
MQLLYINRKEVESLAQTRKGEELMKRKKNRLVQCLMLVILVNQEAEIRKIAEASPSKRVSKTTSQQIS